MVDKPSKEESKAYSVDTVNNNSCLEVLEVAKEGKKTVLTTLIVIA